MSVVSSLTNALRSSHFLSSVTRHSALLRRQNHTVPSRFFRNARPHGLLTNSRQAAVLQSSILRFSSKPDDSQASSTNPAQPAKPSILGGMQGTSGLGLAEEVLKSRSASDSDKSDKAKESSEGGQSNEDDEEAKQRKEAEASWRTMKYSFIFFGVSMTGLAGFILVVWGAPDRDEEGNFIEDSFSHIAMPQQYLYRAWSAIKNYSKMIKDPSRDKLLPEPFKEPYYQPPYTLVLEMTGVLVHPDWTYQTGWRFKKRPGVDFFLSQVAHPAFEVVVYTAEQAFTAFPILDALDPNGHILYKLFRDSTRYVDGHHVKDLDCLNRDLSKVIVVDWNGEAVKNHPRNLLKLKKWPGNDDDRSLIDLAILLKTIASSEVQDVREVLDFYRQFEDPLEAFKENQRILQEQQEQIYKMQQEKAASSPASLVKGFFGRRF